MYGTNLLATKLKTFLVLSILLTVNCNCMLQTQAQNFNEQNLGILNTMVP